MSRRGDAGHDHKRIRTQAASNHRRRSRFSTAAKAKYVADLGEPFLFVRIISAVDIDRDFRPITHNRFYGVQGWIHPGQEYRTQAIRPRFYNMDLDPVWDELLSMPLRQASLEDATLHLDVLRASAAVQDPGTSAKRKLVGRVQISLDQLEPIFYLCKTKSTDLVRTRWHDEQAFSAIQNKFQSINCHTPHVIRHSDLRFSLVKDS